MSSKESISIVVPVYNEEGSIAALHKEITEVCESNQYDYEIIFINDGSSDKTAEICRKLIPLKYIEFRKNFGQTAAMDAGIKAAAKEFIVTLDGDGQNDPHDIPEMMKYLHEKELDIVSGWRKNRKDSFGKRFASRGANFLRGILINDHIHDSGCSLKVYRRECFDGLTLYGEQHRFIPALLMIRGWKAGEIEVHHRPRTSGVTKYNWRRTFKGFTDMLSVRFFAHYAGRPQHLFGSIGLVNGLIGVILLLWTVVRACLRESVTVTLLLALFCLGACLFLIVSGLLAEAVMKNYFDTNHRTVYSIKCISENRRNEE